MKNKIITLGLFTAVVAFASVSKCQAQTVSQAQKQESITNKEIKFDSYGKFAFRQHESLKVKFEKQIQSAQKEWAKIDSAYWNGLIAGYLIANNVPMERVSIKGDSLKVEDYGITLKLKAEKKK